MEIYKYIKGYKRIYKISNLGNVKSLKLGREIILKKGLSSSGYFTVGLYLDGKSKTHQVHQLVAMAFLGHIPSGHKLVVNHKNFDKLDNRVENLEITTQRNNTNRKHIKSSSKYTGVYRCKTGKKWISTIVINGKKNYLGRFKKEIDAYNTYQNKLKELI